MDVLQDRHVGQRQVDLRQCVQLPREAPSGASGLQIEIDTTHHMVPVKTLK
jgi:hypothetical protein